MTQEEFNKEIADLLTEILSWSGEFAGPQTRVLLQKAVTLRKNADEIHRGCSRQVGSLQTDP